MGILRSETMGRGTLVLPQDRARDIVDTLSRNCNIQFVDMNAKQMCRPYKKYIQRILAMERMIRVLYDEIALLPNARIERNHIDNFLENDKVYRLDQVEDSLRKLYDQFMKFKENNNLLKTELEDAINEYYVMLVAKRQHQYVCNYANRGMSEEVLTPRHQIPLEQERALLTDNEMTPVSPVLDGDDDGENESSSSTFFSNIAGVISLQDKDAFSRAVFRAMRGNVYTFFQHTSELQDALAAKGLLETNSEASQTAVFVIYCQSASNSVAFEKLQKLCCGFQTRKFNWSKNVRETSSRLASLEELIRDKRNALDAYQNYFRTEITCLLDTLRPGGNSVIEEWCLFCKKEKYIYYILNHFRQTDITLQAECWYPKEEEANIFKLLAREKTATSVSALLLVNPNIDNCEAPTYNKTNGFTRSFQGVVNTYGVPRYKEVNPAPFTCITFPFLFGIMFGDIGHGIYVFLFALFLILSHRKLARRSTGDVQLMVLNGRYMILLMGIFATYTGFIYNDFLSIPNNFFRTRWVRATDAEIPAGAEGGYYETFVPAKEGFPIPFGLDPAWIHAKNEQPMLHSFKMKFAIIVGFLQMGMGVCLKAFNAIHFKKPLDLYFEFIPQFIMLVSFVGYLAFLIVYKWITPVDGKFAKPSLITTLIDMCMLKNLGPDEIMYNGQQTVQRILVFLMAISVPLMLVPKPLLLYLYHRNQHHLSGRGNGPSDADDDVNTSTNNSRIDDRHGKSKLSQVRELVYVADEEAPETARFRRVSNGHSKEHFAVVVGRDTDSDEGGTGAFHVRGRCTGNSYSSCDEDGDDNDDDNGGDSGHSESITDLFIHQLIETVEFTLGCISNTASYLRLWALSLSHQQLSVVFFNQFITSVLEMNVGVITMVFMLFGCSMGFAVITFFVMLCMDSLECFLHALRLQWVEFQNKFYKADGYVFKPFNIHQLLENAAEDDVAAA